jgi:hypothetical protein
MGPERCFESGVRRQSNVSLKSSVEWLGQITTPDRTAQPSERSRPSALIFETSIGAEANPSRSIAAFRESQKTEAVGPVVDQ